MYKRTIWKDHVEGIQEGTDMNAANFNNLEDGTMEANALAAYNAEYQRHCNDIAKNNEVIEFMSDLHDAETGYVDSMQYVAIPEKFTRNNSLYVVTPIAAGVNGVTLPLILIKSKQANGFEVEIRGDLTFVSVYFQISGGMI